MGNRGGGAVPRVLETPIDKGGEVHQLEWRGQVKSSMKNHLRAEKGFSASGRIC